MYWYIVNRFATRPCVPYAKGIPSMTESNWLGDYDEDLDEDEYPDEDSFDEDSMVLVSCSHCGSEVYEESVACPDCGTYLTSQTSPWAGRSLLWVVLGVAGVIATVLALLF